MRSRVASAALVLLAGLAPLLLPSPASAWVPAGTLHVDGRGYGHGRGMSQWGAKYRADAGHTWQQILAFYYPGTTQASFTAAVRVLLARDTAETTVLPATSMAVRELNTGALHPLPTNLGATQWRLQPGSIAGTTLVSYFNGAWRPWKQLTGLVQVGAPGPTTLLLPDGSRPSYRGSLRHLGPGAGSRTVNVLAIDDYLKGVVPREMPSTWHLEALRVQVVAARTYALHQRQARLGQAFDLWDDTRSQVYGGLGSEAARTNEAIRATPGTYLAHGGQPALTQFSASNGGMTVNGGVAYLPAQADPFDKYPAWRKDVSSLALQRKCPATHPTLKRLQVSSRDGRGGAWGGRALTVDLECYAGGVGKVVRLNATDVRTLLGLKSTWFEFAAK